MSKTKSKNSGKPTAVKLGVRIVVLMIVVAFAAYLIISNLPQNNTTFTETNEQKTNVDTSHTFKKEGELVFLKKDGNEISRIDIEIADNDERRMTGLMYRTKMDENRGMLFIFPYEDLQAFWMKNTVISLDIIFVNSKKEIVKIHRNAIPYSEDSYVSGEPAQYVVEVNAGYTSKNGIEEGDKIAWDRN